MKPFIILTALASLGAISCHTSAAPPPDVLAGSPAVAKAVSTNLIRVADTSTSKKGKGAQKGAPAAPAASGKSPASAAARPAPTPKSPATAAAPTAKQGHGSRGSNESAGTSTPPPAATPGRPAGVPKGAAMVPGSAGNPPTYVMPNTGGSQQYQSNGTGQYERVKPPAGIQ